MIKFQCPLKGNPKVSSGYPYRNDKKTRHYGIDYAVIAGTELFAPGNGKVIRVDNTDKEGYGNQIRIWHPALNITSIMAHLNSMSVKVGKTVKMGDKIGTTGGNPNDDIPGDGSSKGAHLHFEIQVGNSALGSGRTGKKTLNPKEVIEKYS